MRLYFYDRGTCSLHSLCFLLHILVFKINLYGFLKIGQWQGDEVHGCKNV